jgi:PAS domain S-box-containing protein
MSTPTSPAGVASIPTSDDIGSAREQKLRQSEHDLRTITDTIRQSIVVLAPDGSTLYANRVALDLTGATLSEVNEKGFLARVFHPDDAERLREERTVGLLEGLPFELEMRILMKSGEYRWQLVQYDPLKDRTRPDHPLVRHGNRHRRPQEDGRAAP